MTVQWLGYILVTTNIMSSMAMTSGDDQNTSYKLIESHFCDKVEWDKNDLSAQH